MLEHGNKGRRRPAGRTQDAHAWMQRYFNLLGDHMPHNNHIHLPSWDTQKCVYARYKDDMLLQGYMENDIVALRTFYRIWTEDFSNVVIPEVGALFFHFWVKYTICQGFRGTS